MPVYVLFRLHRSLLVLRHSQMVGMVIASLKATFNADFLACVVLLVGGPLWGLVGLIPLHSAVISKPFCKMKRFFLRSFRGVKTHNSGCWEPVPGVREIFSLNVAMDSELASLFLPP